MSSSLTNGERSPHRRETSNVQGVMDGDIDLFIQAKLRGQKAGKGDEREL
jgi:hypothetical protein